jgi:hypothetical protein
MNEKEHKVIRSIPKMPQISTLFFCQTPEPRRSHEPPASSVGFRPAFCAAGTLGLRVFTETSQKLEQFFLHLGRLCSDTFPADDLRVFSHSEQTQLDVRIDLEVSYVDSQSRFTHLLFRTAFGCEDSTLWRRATFAEFEV